MLDAIIIEPSLDKRSNLREIARNFCKSVLALSSLNDGLERIRTARNCDVIYVSSRFDFELASEFVASSKQTESGRDTANLLISPPENLSESYLARIMLKGFDGILLEPASVETFKVSADLALKARTAKLQERQRRSIDVMVRALADQLDEVAIKKRLRQVGIISQEKFKIMGNEIKGLSVSNKEAYFLSLVEQFCARPAPKE